jgi:hypothetical protein
MEVVPGAALLRVGDVLHRCRTRFVAGKHVSLRFLGKATSGRFPLVVDEIRWDEKAGLRTGCGVRSQVIDVLKAQEIKENGNEEG